MSENRREGGYLHDKLTENNCYYTFIVSIKRLCRALGIMLLDSRVALAYS